MGKKQETGKPQRTEAQKVQDKKDAFVRVVTPRVVAAVKAIRLVRACASSNYSYSKEQARAIALALQTSVDEVNAAYEGKVTGGVGFELPKS